MSTLSSSSTDAEVWGAYDDNASYAEDGSASKAAAFVTACRILLRRTPTRSGRGDQQIELDVDQLRRELASAQAWISSGGGTVGGGVVYPDFADFRG